MKVAVFLPVKGNSERIQSKNMKLMDGKPLFLHTLEKLVYSSSFDEVWLDSESEEVFKAASYLNFNKLNRDPELANNKTDGNKLFLNQVKHSDADILVQILCTSPFIKIETINKAIEILKTKKEYDSVVLVQKDKQYTWSDSGPNYDFNKIPNSKDLPDTIKETMGLYVIRRDAALKTSRRIGEKPFLLECSPQEGIDVNWPEDFDLANNIAAGIREKDRCLLNNIKNHLSSSMLSDIFDDLNIKEKKIITSLKINIDNKKIFGRAKTLKLRKIENGEDFRGIYKALDSYATIIPNDVIMVENEVSDYAYFGELNANLAIRSGAVAAVIGGKTRDNSAVMNLGFPTFSKGYVATDVRKRAVMESMNCPISIDEVKINPGDLVFGDAEGILIIPREKEKMILDEVFNRLTNENNILVDIALGKDTKEIVNGRGDF